MISLKVLLTLIATATVCEGFGIHARVNTQIHRLSMSPVNDHSIENLEREISSVRPWKSALIATTAALSVVSPALAVEEDNYEYGAVDAPIGIAVGGGILAILTALLPVVMSGGEEEFEKMKATDKDTWGTGNSDKLKSRGARNANNLKSKGKGRR
mmetsp:Transcript_26007/g.51841  ORF Transcript_26007/g.51841 Transcript_26007/m.51841 type:complete len:156 (+) Transcript_26007:99-566(+)|eukprot:CAMPEP_0194312898 /NCGR_PEP_ID=MMETSP0171-20130528/9808_1 /TAXON_ID=218684 /ORGANISM="Corethron pennatum, Strain L29A3" /LENGTH=155 /DNA_ID=CAMNT_0039067619 /DNA_START=67 /DNA_END=534 /DNA_ORIENTATION=-